MARFTFPEWTETLHKRVLLLLAGAPVVLLALWWFGLTPEAIRIGYQPEQPVPYSHALHVGELGLDCRYCHNTVEEAAFAAVPPAATCMNCHTKILAESTKLLPVREAYNNVKPLAWVKIHDVPDYVYFNHSAHVTRGVGCESCHGRIDQMEEVYQAKALTMGWCLGCHRNPEKHLRPLDAITEMGYLQGDNKDEDKREEEQLKIGTKLATANKINPPINCSTCHR